MRFPDLAGWLAWQETLHPAAIDLRLERVGEVAATLDLIPAPWPVITVGGTNGKGTCASVCAAVLAQNGLRVGLYTSPHLQFYNERIRIDGRPVSDAEIMAAFDTIDVARGSTSLTYFEFGTLAALEVFRRREVDMAVLEVGLGGRLDAVNVVDPDVAIVTSVDIDHVQWLGPDRESIGAEKAGIFRHGVPAIVGDPDPPQSLLNAADSLGAHLRQAGVAFGWRQEPSPAWTWWGQDVRLDALPTGPLNSRESLDNAACALEAVRLLRPQALATVATALEGLRIPGRVQLLRDPVGRGCEWLLDVAHNPAAARVLARVLADRFAGRRCTAILGMLGDKDLAATVKPLLGSIERWHVCDLEGERGRSAVDLEVELISAGVSREAIQRHPDPVSACTVASRVATGDDLIVVTGSFHVVGPAAEWLGVYSPPASAGSA